jgi:prepilin-type N-terminal cleavage/methylation domain-containing protein
MMKRNEGFTLVELIVSIAVSTIVTAGVLSIPLFGMRINAKTAGNVKQQNAMNMLTQIVQSVAEENNITVDEENNIIQSTEGFQLELKSGDIYLNNTVFMEGVLSFEPVMDDENKLLTLTVQVGESPEKAATYITKVYCRLYIPPTPDEGGNTT